MRRLDLTKINRQFFSLWYWCCWIISIYAELSALLCLMENLCWKISIVVVKFQHRDPSQNPTNHPKSIILIYQFWSTKKKLWNWNDDIKLDIFSQLLEDVKIYKLANIDVFFFQIFYNFGETGHRKRSLESNHDMGIWFFNWQNLGLGKLWPMVV